jgi:hypothetical protein
MADTEARFHAHLDQCARCRQQPFNLCDIGASLLRRAVEAIPNVLSGPSPDTGRET